MDKHAHNAFLNFDSDYFCLDITKTTLFKFQFAQLSSRCSIDRQSTLEWIQRHLVKATSGGKWTSTVIRHVGSRDSSLDRDEADSKDLLSSTDDEQIEDVNFSDEMSVEEDCWFEDWEQEPQKIEVRK
jgi:hypothetical protein